MDIIISNSSGKPIYEQITTQIKNKIITGELRPGDALPSMRVLAKELRISVITTKRAYADLEQDGFIETAPGKGSFVAQKNTGRYRTCWNRPLTSQRAAASPFLSSPNSSHYSTKETANGHSKRH